MLGDSSEGADDSRYDGVDAIVKGEFKRRCRLRKELVQRSWIMAMLMLSCKVRNPFFFCVPFLNRSGPERYNSPFACLFQTVEFVLAGKLEELTNLQCVIGMIHGKSQLRGITHGWWSAPCLSLYRYTHPG
jgi:hypothetical protein